MLRREAIGMPFTSVYADESEYLSCLMDEFDAKRVQIMSVAGGLYYITVPIYLS